MPENGIHATTRSLGIESTGLWERRVPLQNRRHYDLSAHQPVRAAAWQAMRLLVVIVFLVTPPSMVRSAPPSRTLTDGAPGENTAPDEPADRFAQVGKDQAEPIKDDDAPPVAEADPEDLEPEEASENADDPRSRRNLDSIDFRAPINRSKQIAWQKIEQAAAGRDWNQVLDRLERFAGSVDHPESEDYLVRHADGSLKSARLSMAELLGTMPANLRAARTRTEATLGNTLLEQALRDNDLRQLNYVAVRFFGTPTGYRAADRLAAQLIDRGEFTLAANWLKLLQNSDSEIRQSPAWQTRTRLILDLTGTPESSANRDTTSEAAAQLRQQFVSSEPAALTQWPLLGGNSKRHAEPDVASRPVMIRRWEFPSTSNSDLKTTISRLIADLTYRSVPTVPAGSPVFVNGRLICRTFRGIEVLDVESGQHLWTTGQSASVEQLLSSASGDDSVADLMPDITPLFSDTVAVDRTGGPIGQFLFQNAAHGLISSDQRTVYFLDDDPVFTLGRTSIRRAGGAFASPRADSTTSNRLQAYDLQTGEPLWQIGGPATREPFAPQLAGWFFLGAPLPDRGDLFIVAQKENAIRLFCLDQASGSTRWSQQIAFAEESLERNLNRRLWSVQLAAAHGVIVCPTTVGWLVGVDRSTGTIVWSHRYSERQTDGLIGAPGLFRGNRGQLELANESIGGTWVPSAPIIMGHRVVFAPAEPRDESDGTTRFLDCVNVFTGERIWSLPREQALSVTGASSGETIVTWPSAVVILKPNGNVRAEIEFAPEDGQPCGRGVVAQGSFWLPLQKHVLLRFDLQQATLAERIEIPAGYPPLGNLAFYQGLLISHATEGITAWELEDTLDSRLARIRSTGDSDKADILEAQLALSRKEFSTAIAILLPRLSAHSGAGLHPSIPGLLMKAASGQVESSPKSGLELLEQVQPLFEASGREGAHFELQRRQLQIEALLKLDRTAEAFDRLTELVSFPSGGTMERVDDSRITVAVDPWLKQQLQKVWSRLSPTERGRSSQQIKALLEQAAANSPSTASSERLATLFDFHPGSQNLAHHLADNALTEKHFADAEHWLRTIAESGTDSQAADSLLKQLTLRTQHLVSDSDTRNLVHRLQQDYSSTALPDGTLVASAMKPLLQTLDSLVQTSPADWGDINLAAVRTAASQQRERSPRLIADRPSSRFRIETQNSGSGSSRLSFFERSNGELFWTVSLRSNNSHEISSGQRLTVHQSGQLFPVLSGGVLNMLSLPERRILWTQPVEELDNSRLGSPARGRPLEDIDDWMLRRRPGSSAAVPVVNSRYLCSRGSKSLTVFNSRTGELQWRLEPLERSLRVFGTHDTIYLTRPDGTISAAHHAIDGQPVDPARFASDLASSETIVKVDEKAIVTVTKNEQEPAITLRAQNPSTQQELWSHSFSGKIKVRQISSNQLAILARFGQINLLDYETGQLTEFEKIHGTLRLGNPEFTILSDGRIVYVILKQDTSTEARQPGLPSVQVGGNLIAFDATNGNRLWTQELPELHLVTERLDQLPFLIMTSYRREFIVQPSEIRRVMVLDKRDGKVLLDTKDEPGEAGFHSLIIDPDNRLVDLISSTERLRLIATPAE